MHGPPHLLISLVRMTSARMYCFVVLYRINNTIMFSLNTSFHQQAHNNESYTISYTQTPTYSFPYITLCTITPLSLTLSCHTKTAGPWYYHYSQHRHPSLVLSWPSCDDLPHPLVHAFPRLTCRTSPY